MSNVLRCPRTIWLVALAAAPLMLAAAVRPAPAAEREDFCRIEKVVVEPLSNAVRIRIIADGMIQYSLNYQDFYDTTSGARTARPNSRIRFTMTNVRGGSIPMVNVATYPVSHIEFRLPEGARDGIGLECVLALYKPGFFRRLSGNPPPLVVQIRQGTSRNELICVVYSDRTLETSSARRTPASVEPHLRVSGPADRLTVDCLDADFSSLVDQLSRLANRPILIGGEVNRRVAAALDGLPLPTILAALTDAYGLSLSEQDGIYYVALGNTGTAASAWGAATRTLPLRHIQAAQALRSLPDVVLAYARPESNTNSLVLSGPKAFMDRVEHDLNVLDQPTWHCRLRAWVISALGEERDLREVEAALSAGETRWSAAPDGQVEIERLPGQPTEILARLTALQQAYRLKMQATPSIQVLNGRPARLFFGENVYYWRVDQSLNASLASVEAGTVLEMTPQVGGEWIGAKIRIESNILDQVNELGPMVERRAVNTAVRLKSGDTLLIGGLRTDDVSGQTDRTPAAWPLDHPLARKGAQSSQRAIWVLVSAEASQDPISEEQPQTEATP